MKTGPAVEPALWQRSDDQSFVFEPGFVASPEHTRREAWLVSSALAIMELSMWKEVCKQKALGTAVSPGPFRFGALQRQGAERIISEDSFRSGGEAIDKKCRRIPRLRWDALSSDRPWKAPTRGSVHGRVHNYWPPEPSI